MYLALASCAIFGWASFTSGPGAPQIRLIVALLAAITFYLLFWRDLKHIFHRLFSQNIDQEEQVIPASRQSALPPAQSRPAATPGSLRINTAEMVQPASITEHTTQLLDKT
jgi:hypothetical protein